MHRQDLISWWIFYYYNKNLNLCTRMVCSLYELMISCRWEEDLRHKMCIIVAASRLESFICRATVSCRASS